MTKEELNRRREVADKANTTIYELQKKVESQLNQIILYAPESIDIMQVQCLRKFSDFIEDMISLLKAEDESRKRYYEQLNDDFAFLDPSKTYD